MVNRVYIDGNSPRVLCSKPGKDANPSMSNIDKTFDSDWFTGGGIRWKLRYDVVGRFLNDVFMAFPIQLNYTPRVQVFGFKPWYEDNYLFPSRNMSGVSWWNPPVGAMAMGNEFMQPYFDVSNSGVTVHGTTGSPYGIINDIKLVAFVYGD